MEARGEECIVEKYMSAHVSAKIRDIAAQCMGVLEMDLYALFNDPMLIIL